LEVLLERLGRLIGYRLYFVENGPPCRVKGTAQHGDATATDGVARPRRQSRRPGAKQLDRGQAEQQAAHHSDGRAQGKALRGDFNFVSLGSDFMLQKLELLLEQILSVVDNAADQ